MDEKLLNQFKLLDEYLIILDDISKYNKEMFLKDKIVYGAAERYLQLAIETCINVGNRVISLNQFDKQIDIPNTYADVFNILAKMDIIPQDFANNLVGMAKFRNKLVHNYWEIDRNKVFDIISNNLIDIKRFRDYMLKFLKKET
ncbi:Uncharacterized conserved protein YutE, UPF0331/DUF86 family [Caldanaerobius fijiensis DSM 17918]|uniref:Uncharacterized conserved protein YutE, UPF0331/DUF86 family n=1 Tax=Caldanaerobius fijiensis DSM 17918 TaxID=1121256 RepID=A0A1M5F4E8_9THEO|nr:DUF86 domain-containing protein [Caldanaerobius fijiensis]SHF86258.1 Uncharacterized conserved protein YutE, UPF0331/DUF86 family [Caldanaerobius fijiensis DSM 17918]